MWNIARLRLINARDHHRDRSEIDQASQEQLGFILCIAKKNATKALQSQKSLNCREPSVSCVVRCRKQAPVFRIPDYLFKVHCRLDVHVFSSLCVAEGPT
jgi:hypothetical protein